ncbi:unnamed protein product [Cylicocyclus nassatus]|uniref:Uncharacterized protein n=1 Tax=Cylicocyclus nassatus TaxID=53992 RepID=A0AA36MEB1_CYLNA|nr:unnamed protein product [Cylicocyclus nassatus]
MFTAVARIEAIINTRPLTKVNASDIAQLPLRPIDFLRGNLMYSIPTDPQVGEIALIERELLSRGCWSYSRIVDNVKSADGSIRSALILLPNKKIVQRSVNTIFSLEIRSVSEEPITQVEEALTQPLQTVEKNVRKMPERAFKMKAYDAIKECGNRLNQSAHILKPTFSVFLVAILTLVSPIKAQNSSSAISCCEGKVHIPWQGAPYTLCIDNDCKTIDNTTHGMRYALPISPINTSASVRFSKVLTGDGAHESTLICKTPQSCDHQKLSKTLLGNPHCWPFGAIVTVPMILYFIS